MALSLPLLTLSMDVNGMGTVLVPLGRQLDLTPAATNWVMAVNVMAFASALIPLGRLAGRLRRRRLLLAGVAGFGAGSLLCAVAPDLPALLLGRAVQGVAGALCFTTSLAVLESAFSGRRRAVAIGAWGAVSGLGAVAGPLVGGALATAWTWRAFFALNLPVAALAIPLLLVSTRPDPGRDPGGGTAAPSAPAVPWTRLAALAAGSALAVVGLQEAGSTWWGDPVVIACLAAAAGCVAVELLARRRPGLPGAAGPLVSLSVVANGLFARTAVVAATTTWGFGVTVVYVAVFLQEVSGRSPFQAGLVFCAYSAAFSAVGLLNGPVVHRLGLRGALVLGAAVSVVGLAALAVTVRGPALVPLVVSLVVAGAGQGLAFNASTGASLDRVPERDAAEASGVVQTFRLLGFAAGVAASSALVAGGAPGPAGPTRQDVTGVLLMALAVAAVGLAGSLLPGLRRGPARAGVPG